MISFDVLLETIGYAGLAQAIALLMIGYSSAIGGIIALATVFIAYPMDYRCNVPPIDNETVFPQLNENDILNLTTPVDTVTGKYSTCYRYGYNLSECSSGNLSCVNKSAPVIKCDEGYFYDRDLFTSTVISEFNMVCDQAYLEPLSTSIIAVGVLIGSALFGNVADRFGRKPVLILSYIAALGCMFGVTFSTSAVMYIVFRAGSAGFHYGTAIAGFVYLMEVYGPKQRTFVGMVYQMGYPIGYMVFGGLSYHWRDWRDVCFAGTIISIPFLFFTLVLPESPRWLFAAYKEEQGIKVVNFMGKINRRTIPDETWRKARKIGQEQEDRVAINIRLKLKHFETMHRPDPDYLIRLVVYSPARFVNSFVYYGISLNAGSLAGDIFVNNTLNGVFEIASYAFCILVMDRIGRKSMLCFMFLLAGIGLSASAIVNEYSGDNQSLITLGLVFAFAAKFGISGSFAIIYNFTSEIFPTVVRSNAFGVTSVCARIGGIAAPYLIVAQDALSWLPNVVFGICAVVAGLLSFIFPETNGKPLLETIEQSETFYKTGKVLQSKHEASLYTSFSRKQLPATSESKAIDKHAFDGDMELKSSVL